MSENKINNLIEIFNKISSPINIACSGGLDSRLLAFVAKEYGFQVNLLHIVGQHIDQVETRYLKEFAHKYDMPLTCINFDLFQFDKLVHNDKLRCYYCKYEVFSDMLKHCENKILCDGTHFDDFQSYRPGLKALKELNICSPFALAKFTKTEIKQLAVEINLDNPNQNPRPCLLTRFDYNVIITEEKINFIQFAEEELQKLLAKNFVNLPEFRIREIFSDNYEVHSNKEINFNIIQDLKISLEKNNYFFKSLNFTKLEKLSSYFDVKL